MIISKPVGGYSSTQWKPGDRERWEWILKKLYHNKPLTALQKQDLTELMRAYKLDRFYELKKPNNESNLS